MNEKPILYDYFSGTADLLLAEFERSKQQKSSSNLGKNRESFCKEFLSKVLPPKISVKSGEILDSENNKTGQLDVILLRDDCPALHIGTDDVYLSEGVFAVIEIKSNLSRDKLIEAGNSLVNVSKLKINIGATFSSEPKLDRAMRVVFAFDGAKWETLIEEINKQNWQNNFDLICILNRGVLLKKGGLLDWQSEKEFMVINSKAAALGYLYFYLISYGTSFIGRSLMLNKYFEPLNKWNDVNPSN